MLTVILWDMRYGPNHKKLSRDRILDVAGRQFRAKGSEAVRVADVMLAAGLTHGGFYKHFADKDQLLREAIRTALDQIATRFQQLAESHSRPEALRTVIQTYLSREHMLNPDLGCALAALGTELGRMPAEMKQAVGEALDAYADRLDFLMPGDTAAQRRAGFLVLFSSMAGCVMSARAHASEARQQQILVTGRAFFEQTFCSDQTPAFLETIQ